MTANLEPYRERLRHRSARNGAHQGRALTDNGPAHGLHAGDGRLENLAALKGENQLPKVVAGVTFKDGTEVIERPSTRAA